jgi:hypothetical protein
MPIYTVCSIDPSKYNEITVNLPYANSQKVVDITVMSICTLFNVELLNDMDFIIIEVGAQPDPVRYTIKGRSCARLSLDTMADRLTELFHAASLDGFRCELQENNTLKFICAEPLEEFTIRDMSYNFRIATGFYYAKALPLTATLYHDDEVDYYYATPKACPFTASTPVLYLMNNMGGQCFRMNTDEINMQNGVVGMIIHNSFSPGMPLIFQQGDITSQCLSSDLTYIRLSLVDSNFMPVRLLNPMFCTISVADVADSPY